MHACIVDSAKRRLAAPYGAPLADEWTCAAQRAQHAARLLDTDVQLGAQLLSLVDGAAPAAVATVATAALLRLLSQRFRELVPGAGAGGARKAEGVDMGAPNVEEASLAVAPVAALRRRVQLLLERFEAQPMLLQLATICDRLQGVLLPVLPVRCG